MPTHTREPTVLVVIGLVVIIVIAGVTWLRRDKAPTTPSAPGYQLTMGAMTQWSCGHQSTLSRSLDSGVTIATAPCPFCGRQGIVGQYVAGSFTTIAAEARPNRYGLAVPW